LVSAGLQRICGAQTLTSGLTNEPHFQTWNFSKGKPDWSDIKDGFVSEIKVTKDPVDILNVSSFLFYSGFCKDNRKLGQNDSIV